jgi:membrane protein implicated in regulation of membrane protease activity
MPGPMMAQGAMGQRMTKPGMMSMMPTDELWRARVRQGVRPVRQGENVRVRGIDGLTLLVEPENNRNTP